jgi:EF-P beta-lysylation protein EpmB
VNFLHRKPPLWSQILKTNFFQLEKLADFLCLSPEQKSSIEPKPRFRLNLPLRLASKIRKADLNDPILKQFLPTREESNTLESFVDDPVGDLSFCHTPKMLQKYHGRVLLICTNACAMHCRFCFRQNYPYETVESSFDQELKIIEADSSLQEVILSGGDPLSLSDETLGSLFQRLNAIPHVRRVRFHTRFPMGIPERIDAEFLNVLKSLDKQVWFIIHSNHPAEFDQDVWASLKSISKLGIPILNQSVLLQGVNDNIDTMKELCEQLVDHGITPYYLHQLDRVKGTSHFEVAKEKGSWLVEELRKQLSGYAVPLYVAEIQGEPSKTPL